MKLKLTQVLPLICFWIIFAAPALSDDAPFLTTDPACVLGRGEKTIQQWIVIGHGHSDESYNSLSSQTEFDYGVTDRLQASLILLYDWSRSHVPGSSTTTSSLVGLHGEAVWSIAKTDEAPLGIALAVDPAFNPSSRAIAIRLLFTKYMARFENVLDINFENNWDKDEFGHWQPSSAITFNYGLAHALDHGWTIGIELGNEVAFSSLLTQAELNSLASSIYAGPTVQYEGSIATISVGLQAQLPFSSGSNTKNGYQTDAERLRLALRVTRAI